MTLHLHKVKSHSENRVQKTLPLKQILVAFKPPVQLEPEEILELEELVAPADDMQIELDVFSLIESNASDEETSILKCNECE